MRPGTVTGFPGPNGAGKSTTTRMMLGLDRPTAGEALIGGRSYGELRDPLRTVGALLDAKWVHPNRSAHAHLAWLARSKRLPATRVDEVLELVGLTAVAGKRAGGFSLGMSQRLGIAAALLGDLQVLLFDEPVNGLDPEGILWIRRFMQSLAAEGRTVFVSSRFLQFGLVIVLVMAAVSVTTEYRFSTIRLTLFNLDSFLGPGDEGLPFGPGGSLISVVVLAAALLGVALAVANRRDA